MEPLVRHRGAGLLRRWRVIRRGRRSLHLLAALMLLLVQWHLVLHVHEQHDEGGVCELCIAAMEHQQASPAANLQIAAIPQPFIEIPVPPPGGRPLWFGAAYRVRAPPCA